MSYSISCLILIIILTVSHCALLAKEITSISTSYQSTKALSNNQTSTSQKTLNSELSPLRDNVILSYISFLRDEDIRFCAGIHEWPPYYYFQRPNRKNRQVVGLDIELFNEIFHKYKITYTVELMSWKKCLAEVKRGKKYDVVFGGGLNNERRETYITTKGYYSVVTTYFYHRRTFPDGINVESSLNFKVLGRLCGVKGFNYVNFGQNNNEVEMGAENYERLVLKTLKQRCDISFARKEILIGWGNLLGVDFINNEDLVFNPVPHTPKESFHLMISPQYKFAEELKALFESEVIRLQHENRFNWLSISSN